MKTLKNKSTAFTIVSIIVLSLSMFAILPMTSARNIDVWIYLNLAPNPTGLGQQTTLITWISQNTPTATAGTGVGEKWQDITVTVTKPNGSQETLGPYTADPVGFVATFYTPDQVGTYTFQSHFPGQTLSTGDFYPAADSYVLELVVQQDMVEPEPGVPFTNDYWERPIYAENHDWWPKTGNWLMPGFDTMFRFFDQGSAYNPYGDGPESAHIMWMKPITDGGLIGGSYGSASFYTGMSYEMKLTPPLVIDGKYFYNLYPAGQGTGFAVLDLQTGEELWRNKEETISCGWIPQFESPNQHGGQTFLWNLGATYKLFDAFNGDLITEIENVTAGTARFATYTFESQYVVGDLQTYTIADGNLTLWSASKCLPREGDTPGTTEFDQFRPWKGAGGALDWKDGIVWSVPVPEHPGIPGINEGIVNEDVLVVRYYQPNFASGGIYSGLGWVLNVGYDTTTGAELWVQNRTQQGATYFVWQMLDYSHATNSDVYTWTVRDQLRTYGFDIYTGNQLWVTDPREDAWGEFPGGQIIAYDHAYVTGFDGKVYAYNLADGSTDWVYWSGNAGADTPYGTWPFYSGLLVGDDKIYASNGEHSPQTPLWRGEQLHVINAHTGEKVFSIAGWFISHGNVIADGYFVGLNGYDNQLYCFGKGPSETTVSAPKTAVPVGTKVLIEGSVLDMSAANEGTPCVAPESMSAWMEYLHMQQECPAEVNGVPVELTAVRLSDGMTVDLGTKWTNGFYGIFDFEWTPQEEGQYTLYATFMGDVSYGSSSAATGLLVGPAPSPSGQIEPEPTEGFALGTTELAIIAVVIIALVGIVAFLAIRRRK